MKTPRFTQGVALLLWGWSTDLILYAIAMAVLLEARHLTRRRWNLDKTDLYRVADLTTVILIALVIYLATSVPVSHFLISLVRLSPALFYPLILVMTYSTFERMPLDVIFYSLRRQPGNTAEWDVQLLYIGICLVATGTDTAAQYAFLPLAALLICWSLWPGRPRRYPLPATLTTIVAAFAVATALHTGLHSAHLLVKEKTTAWLADLMESRRDPFRAATAIGAIGRLKLSDAIVMRVKLPREDHLLYLQEASYDWLSGTEWMTMQRSFRPLDRIDEFSWVIQSSRSAGDRVREARIYQELRDDRDLVPVPPGVVAIENYPALELMMNRYDSVQATGIMSPPAFTVAYAGHAADGATPDAADRKVPDEYAELVDREIARIVPADAPAETAVAAIRAFFAPFYYSLYQPHTVERGDALAHFLNDSHAGHCEFFATATVLLLRAAGIPARYSVGYVVQEFDSFTGMYLVRKRHAHAWASAWIDGRWEIVDTTPSRWFADEAAESSIFTPLRDLISNALFRFTLWRDTQKLEDYTGWLYGLAFVLTLVLVYRLMRSEQVLVGDDSGPMKDGEAGGVRSPFRRIETRLSESGFGRLRGEPLLPWVERIGHEELKPLVDEHYAWRFDPRGISATRRDALARAVDDWLATWTAEHAAGATRT